MYLKKPSNAAVKSLMRALAIPYPGLVGENIPAVMFEFHTDFFRACVVWKFTVLTLNCHHLNVYLSYVLQNYPSRVLVGPFIHLFLAILG